MPENPGDRTDISDPGEDDILGMDRRTFGIGILGLTGLAATSYAVSEYTGGKAEPSAPPATSTETKTATATSSPTATDTATPTATETSTPTATPTATATPEPGFGYTVNEEAETVAFRTEEGEFTASYNPQDLWYDQEGSEDVQFGVQDNGDLIALNTSDKIVYEFEADIHPDPNMFDLEGDHPLEGLYDDLDVDESELPEPAARVISGSGEDWAENRLYKEVEVDQIFSHLSKYEGGEAMAVDYFMDPHASASKGETVYKSEFQHLLGTETSESIVSHFL